MDYLMAMRAFIRTVELGSFSLAATELDVKVSTISRHITALESDLGAALLNRSTRRLHLTEAGTLFFDRATQILLAVEEARAATASLNESPRGVLRISMPTAFGRLHVMPHIKDFVAEYPEIRIAATLTDATVDLIETGDDVAVRIGSLTDSSLVARRLASHRRILVASPGFLRQCEPISRPRDVARQQCLIFTLQSGDCWYARRSDDSSTEPLQIAVSGNMRANDSEALQGAALAGLGIALLPSWLVGDDLRAGRLVVPLAGWDWFAARGPEPAIWGVYPPKKIVSPKVRSFIDFLARRYGSPAYWDRRSEAAVG
ncbi:LysR family transcriptional regulator [Rhodopseudomonas palustris]|uniref:Transcriptional regulator, LysR family n=1 Tax=Rhodopseudomonas palustris (strain BisB18) TaxID=316056 RepID=Q20XN3_RHOPB